MSDRDIGLLLIGFTAGISFASAVFALSLHRLKRRLMRLVSDTFEEMKRKVP